LPIGNEYSICVFEQFDTIHVCDLRNMVGKLVNKTGTEEEVTIEIMKLVMEVADERMYYIVNSKKVYFQKGGRKRLSFQYQRFGQQLELMNLDR